MTTRLFYSGSERGFYDDESDLPPDAVEISHERYEELALAQQSGRIILPGPDGYPVAPEREPPTDEQVRAQNTLARDDLLSTVGVKISPLQDAVDLGISTEAERAQLAVLKAYRVQLFRMDLSPRIPVWPTLPQDQP